MRIASLPLIALLAALNLGLTAPNAGAVPSLDHVIVVVMENKGYLEASSPPYTTSLMASGAYFPSFYAYYHPSQPNYFVLWSGSNQGVNDDVCPATGSPFTTENLGHACEVAGKTWRAYSEDLPGIGSTACTYNSSLYTRKHAPWTYFGNIDHGNERPYADLASDIANQTLPNLAFVIPNNQHNSHDSGYGVTNGDNWLANNVPAMIDAVGPQGIVVVTWDEDDGIHGNRVLTIIKGAGVRPGYSSPNFYLHWNLVRTICDGLGIAAPGLAPTADPIDDIWIEGAVGVKTGSSPMLSLSAPAPNPSRGAISARLSLPAPVEVEASIYDLAGRAVRGLANGPRSGQVELRWDGRREDGRPAGAGVYLLRVRAGGVILQRKVLRIP